jgi:hypothetical protein
MRRLPLALVCAASAGAIIGGSYIPAAAHAATVHDGQREFCQAYVADYFAPSWAGLLAASHDVRGASPRTARAFDSWRHALVTSAQPWTVQAGATRVFTACGMRMPS